MVAKMNSPKRYCYRYLGTTLKKAFFREKFIDFTGLRVLFREKRGNTNQLIFSKNTLKMGFSEGK